MEQKNQLTGHLLALLSTVVWGTTFISTKVLLESFSPVEILFFRFVIGFTALCFFRPLRLRFHGWPRELYYIGAGISGVTLYFLMENVALTYTQASNVGVIVAVAPLFTALFSRVFLRSRRLGAAFFVGLGFALAGTFLVMFGGQRLEIYPTGDLLAFGAAVTWAVYSILIQKIGSFGDSSVEVTRKVFLYGLVCMLPALPFFPFSLGLGRFAMPVNLLNIFYLGLGASAICFLTWNIAIRVIGPVKSSVYIYLVPVVTVITSMLILEERLTMYSGAGTALILVGLFLSERRAHSKGGCDEEQG